MNFENLIYMAFGVLVGSAFGFGVGVWICAERIRQYQNLLIKSASENLQAKLFTSIWNELLRGKKP